MKYHLLMATPEKSEKGPGLFKRVDSNEEMLPSSG